MSVSFRRGFPGLILLAAVLCGCHKANIAQLPDDWPLKRVGLPEDSAVFEGHVNADVDLGEGARGKQWTVFFTCDLSYPDVVDVMEQQLRPLKFLKQNEEPDAMPAGGGPITFSSAYCSEDGTYLVFVLYEESAESRASIGSGYYTLMLQRNEPPLPPADDYQPLD